MRVERIASHRIAAEFDSIMMMASATRSMLRRDAMRSLLFRDGSAEFTRRLRVKLPGATATAASAYAKRDAYGIQCIRSFSLTLFIVRFSSAVSSSSSSSSKDQIHTNPFARRRPSRLDETRRGETRGEERGAERRRKLVPSPSPLSSPFLSLRCHTDDNNNTDNKDETTSLRI